MKKKTKKTISFILSAMMLIGMMTGAEAAALPTEYPTIADSEMYALGSGWSVAHDQGGGPTYGNIKAISTVSHSGNLAGYLTGGTSWTHIYNNGTTLTSGETYTVELYSYGEIQTPSVNVLTMGTDWAWAGWSWSPVTLTKAGEDGDWVKYTGTLTPSATGTLRFSLTIGSGKKLIVDDVAVYAADDTTKANLLTNGDFEDAPGFGSTLPTEYPTIADSEIYALRSGWSVGHDQGGTTYGNIKAISTVSHSGNLAGYLTGSGSWTRIYNNGTTLTNGKAYTVELYSYGAIETPTVGVLTMGTDWSWAGWEYSKATLTKAGEDGDWVKYTGTLTPPATGTLRFSFSINSGKKLIVDDVAVYAADDTTKTNLLANGDFEDISYNIEVQNKENAFVSDKWTTNKGVGYAGDDIFIEPTKAEAADGEYSMHFVFPTSLFGTGNNWIEIQETDAVLTEGVTNYDISIKIKGFRPNFKLYHGNSEIDYTIMKKSETDSDGWVTYSITNVELQDVPRIRIWQPTDFYLDNIVVAPTGTTNNIYTDGSFEAVSEPDATPMNLIAYPVQAGGALNISWINGVNTNNIEVIVDGEVKATFSDVTKDLKGEYLVEGLQNGKKYNITVKAISATGKTYSASCIGIPAENSQITHLRGWDILTGADTVADYNDAVVEIITSTMNTTGNALQVKANMDDSTKGVFITQQNVSLSEEYGYQISLKAKTTGTATVTPVVRNSQNGEFAVLTRISDTVGNGYTTYVYQIQSISAATLEIGALIRGMGTCQIDDVEVVTVDFGDVGTQNLFTNADFDTAGYVITTPTFTMNGESLKKITAAGNVTVTTGVSNMFMGDDFNVCVMVALYDGSRLENVTLAKKTVAEKTDGLPPEEFIMNIAVPDLEKGDYSIKAMVWDDISTLTPLCPFNEIKE